MDMVHCLTARVGLVHQMPFTYDRPGFVSVLEKVRPRTVSPRTGPESLGVDWWYREALPLPGSLQSLAGWLRCCL